MYSAALDQAGNVRERCGAGRQSSLLTYILQMERWRFTPFLSSLPVQLPHHLITLTTASSFLKVSEPFCILLRESFFFPPPCCGVHVEEPQLIQFWNVFLVFIFVTLLFQPVAVHVITQIEQQTFLKMLRFYFDQHLTFFSVVTGRTSGTPEMPACELHKYFCTRLPYVSMYYKHAAIVLTLLGEKIIMLQNKHTEHIRHSLFCLNPGLSTKT